MLRKKVASKARKIIKAQEEKEAPVPKITDEGPTGLGEPKAKPPAVPAEPDVGKEDVEEEVKEELKKEKKEEATLDTIKDVLETIVEALEDQKKVLEKSLLGKTEEEEDFDEFKEKEDLEGEEEFTPEEFGINPEELIVSREEKMTAAKRRQKRKARLYKHAKKARTLSEEFEEDKAKKKTFKPSAPAPSITKVKSDETPTMFKLAELALELNDSKDKWTVLKASEEGETPIYEINKKEEENFATEDFANKIFENMKENGVEATLKSYGAEEFKGIERKKEVEPIQDEEEKKTIGDYKRQFNRAFRLAISAMDKNLIQNPLKGAFYDMLTDVGLDDKTAKNVIEAAFAKGAIDHIETALAQTDKYLDMSDEALVETESTIGDLRTKAPEFEGGEGVEEDTPEFSSRAEAMRKRAAKASLPISTESASDPTDRVAILFDALPKPKLSGISRV